MLWRVLTGYPSKSQLCCMTSIEDHHLQLLPVHGFPRLLPLVQSLLAKSGKKPSSFYLAESRKLARSDEWNGCNFELAGKRARSFSAEDFKDNASLVECLQGISVGLSSAETHFRFENDTLHQHNVFMSYV
jgi:hypothetical protein